MHLKLLAALAAAAALAVAGCGSDDETTGENRAQAPGNGADRAFVAEMIPHHRSAVQMAELAQQRAESDFVRQLADDIVRTQNAEITTMRREDAALAQAGIRKGSLGVPQHMAGMDMDPAMLEDADPFDRAFLRMMIPHHQGAITMAEAELARGADPELKQLAQEITDAQQREIREMRAHLGDSSAGATDPEHSDH